MQVGNGAPERQAAKREDLGLGCEVAVVEHVQFSVTNETTPCAEGEVREGAAQVVAEHRQGFDACGILDDPKWCKSAAVGVGRSKEMVVDLIHTVLSDEIEQLTKEFEAGVERKLGGGSIGTEFGGGRLVKAVAN